jgi:hypothetical protein
MGMHGTKKDATGEGGIRARTHCPKLISDRLVFLYAPGRSLYNEFNDLDFISGFSGGVWGTKTTGDPRVSNP